jgi:hypothetical protein
MNLQIPDLHISTRSEAKGRALVKILPSRQDMIHTGRFSITELAVAVDPANLANPYPTGNVVIDVDLSDSFKGTIQSTTIEQLSSWGKHSPTAVLTGHCDFKPRRGQKDETPKHGWFWLLLADNSSKEQKEGTPDVVSFLAFDAQGNRVAYGTGPVVDGDIVVMPT